MQPSPLPLLPSPGAVRSLPANPPAYLHACLPAQLSLTPLDVHAGNLLVLPDGRVAFIDFGIVGRIR